MDLNQLTEFEPNAKIEEFSPGDTVRVSVKVTEGDRTRIQNFEGTVIRKRGAGMSSTFTSIHYVNTRERKINLAYIFFNCRP